MGPEGVMGTRPSVLLAEVDTNCDVSSAYLQVVGGVRQELLSVQPVHHSFCGYTHQVLQKHQKLVNVVYFSNIGRLLKTSIACYALA